MILTEICHTNVPHLFRIKNTCPQYQALNHFHSCLFPSFGIMAADIGQIDIKIPPTLSFSFHLFFFNFSFCLKKVKKQLNKLF